ncbi:hypothetical protein ABZ930_20490 [Streptomyces sp. NPDC046716]|uniref:hypothetical protein n=1 Tax=Streptomyces sp. NPDC046716 TaxID=3157093 RepID=UPI0033C712EE
MSGSPKYSSVRVGALYAQREAEERRRRAEERRARELRRAAERDRIARAAAARRERARAEAARKEAEVTARREAERAARRDRARAEQSRADERGLEEVRGLVAEAQRSGVREGIGALEGELAALRVRLARGEPLDGAVEELRGKVVGLRGTTDRGRTGDRADVLAGLERRLSASEGTTLDAEGHQRCNDLIGQLRAATAPDQQARFEALLGTVEHALDLHAATVGQARETAEREARAERDRAVERERVAEEERAAERKRAEAEEALELALAEAAERLDAVRPAAQGVVNTAAGLGAPDLADTIDDALRAAGEALAARSPGRATAAVEDLESRLPDAESRLDELELADERRRDLVAALRDAMTGEGFAFEGGAEEDGAFRLHFTRPTGATYETTVASEEDGTPVLVYRVEGEPDVTLHAARDEAVCDTTEALLERVHESLGGDDGFVPGEITWDGKPPGRRAKPLPRESSWRWTTP